MKQMIRHREEECLALLLSPSPHPLESVWFTSINKVALGQAHHAGQYTFRPGNRYCRGAKLLLLTRCQGAQTELDLYAVSSSLLTTAGRSRASSVLWESAWGKHTCGWD
ncbi:hypothetical protein EYF80_015811 [Liparis tanakae]|uniref:Uncharacterized protein n=1 Tax=Liparis tanakae TaxID=230148 RepID=A0A4Z2I805_9TELE|nr:hypothetical protein EYF80_015811 [Liparis tanakae]